MCPGTVCTPYNAWLVHLARSARRDPLLGHEGCSFREVAWPIAWSQCNTNFSVFQRVRKWSSRDSEKLAWFPTSRMEVATTREICMKFTSRNKVIVTNSLTLRSFVNLSFIISHWYRTDTRYNITDAKFVCLTDQTVLITRKCLLGKLTTALKCQSDLIIPR